jgi:ABC-type oligopeptide transport system ATPase subunit
VPTSGTSAYTSGSHVVIGEGGGGKHTLAHELTHVIQQRQGHVAGTDNGAGLRVSDPSDRFEREAEANARAVMSRPALSPSFDISAPRTPMHAAVTPQCGAPEWS